MRAGMIMGIGFRSKGWLKQVSANLCIGLGVDVQSV